MNSHQNRKNMQVGASSAPVAWHELSTSLNFRLYLALVDLPLPGTEDSLLGSLTNTEQETANGFKNREERLHFIGRRAFQSWFVSSIAGHETIINRDEDGAPLASALPGWSISFSSTPSIAAAAACADCEIGLDIEQKREVENAVEISRRFFTLAEAAEIEGTRPALRSEIFLRYWSAKEACLKLIGKGMVYGPEQVELELANSRLRIKSLPAELGAVDTWQLLSPDCFGEVFVTLACRNR